MKRLLALVPILAVLALAPTREGRAMDPMGPNAACYVCHPTFVKEELSRTHLRKKVTCIKCHGLSAKHANDEDIGATRPDRTYNRGEVRAMCRRCHKTHNVPAEAVVARWLERERTESPPICTDCHGRHRVETAGEGQAK
jgi:hypothetical protein